MRNKNLKKRQNKHKKEWEVEARRRDRTKTENDGKWRNVGRLKTILRNENERENSI